MTASLHRRRRDRRERCSRLRISSRVPRSATSSASSSTTTRTGSGSTTGRGAATARARRRARRLDGPWIAELWARGGVRDDVPERLDQLVIGPDLGVTFELRRDPTAAPRDLSSRVIDERANPCAEVQGLITKDWVTAPLRAAFTEYQGSSGAGEVTEKPRGKGTVRSRAQSAAHAAARERLHGRGDRGLPAPGVRGGEAAREGMRRPPCRPCTRRPARSGGEKVLAADPEPDALGPHRLQVGAGMRSAANTPRPPRTSCSALRRAAEGARPRASSAGGSRSSIPTRALALAPPDGVTGPRPSASR